MMSLRRVSYSTPYDLHKKLINLYVLTRPGATAALKRDTTKDRTDADVLREKHRFVWEEGEVPGSWEESLAKRYYDKLYKEYAIADLSRYKLNKVGLRWQTEKEMMSGKGQFVCGSKSCAEEGGLRTWEVNFAYVEHGLRKNSLVKLRLCSGCSDKLNYCHKKKEVKRLKKRTKDRSSKKRSRPAEHVGEEGGAEESAGDSAPTAVEESRGDNIWAAPEEEETALSREEEFEHYLEELLL